MSKNIKTQLGKIVGRSLNDYYQRVKPTINELKFKEKYQGRIIDCMTGEVDDNYIETPETDAPVVKLEHSKEGLVKVPSIKGKTILLDSEGNETDTPAEGCRLVSVGEEEDNKLIILSKNKNLFNGEIERYFINTSTGQNNGWMEYWRSKDYIRCTPNEKYLIHFKYKGVKKSGAMFFYDKDKNYIGMTYNNPTTTPSNCEFIRITGHAENSGTLIDITKVTDIMFCKGVNASDYIEPKHHKTEILLKTPLRKLPNGVCDEIIDNKIIRRVGKVTWGKLEDGATRHNADYAWGGKEDTETHYIIGINVGMHNWHGIDNIGNINKIAKCNRLKLYQMTSFEIGNSNQRGYILMYLPKEEIDGECNTLKVKEWLDVNKPTIIYPLAEPIIEELPNGITLQGFNDTTMYIENSITPTIQYGYNALIPYKEELKNQKEEVEYNTLDIEQNIIPYLMDMEFNLMTMEDNI